MNEKSLQLVNYEQAKALKKLGFDWESDIICDDPVYLQDGQILDGDEYPQPTVALALKWCRDVKDYFFGIHYKSSRGYSFHFLNGKKSTAYTRGVFNIKSYEAAESALLDEIINSLKQE